MGAADFSKIPNGHPAIENRMELLFSEGVNKGRITLNKYVEVASTNAAKIFGMFPKKGTIAVGSDADIFAALVLATSTYLFKVILPLFTPSLKSSSIRFSMAG